MLAAGHSKKTRLTHTEGEDTIHTPLCMDTYIKAYQGGTEPPRGKKTEEEERENM